MDFSRQDNIHRESDNQRTGMLRPFIADICPWLNSQCDVDHATVVFIAVHSDRSCSVPTHCSVHTHSKDVNTG